ncbi:MAG: methanogenesis marker 7 protein [Methermicoccaceae archaeon]
MFEPVMFEGGVHKHQHILELVEDLGGYVLETNVMQTEINILMLIPDEDIPYMERLAKKLLGKITVAPLAGTEIAVVAPSLSSQHLPHPSCDIAEFMRRQGANTDLIGLSRGVGKRVAVMSSYERELINEHDLAIFVFGNFKACIVEKAEKLLSQITIPVVALGGPEVDCELPVERYIDGFGRIAHRLRKKTETDQLEKVVSAVSDVLKEKRERMATDPLTVFPARARFEIHTQIPETGGILSPTPLTLQLEGLKVKLPYDEFSEKVANVKFEEGALLKDIAHIRRSRMKDYILVKIRASSETGMLL